MKRLLLLSVIMGLAACGGGGTGGGTATYRVEFSGSLNTGATFRGTYATQSGQVEIVSETLPASKEFTAKANEFVLASGDVSGGGTITVKAFKNNALCEEKTLSIGLAGAVTAACNKP